jgi:hypothetical protein
LFFEGRSASGGGGGGGGGQRRALGARFARAAGPGAARRAILTMACHVVAGMVLVESEVDSAIQRTEPRSVIRARARPGERGVGRWGAGGPFVFHAREREVWGGR